MFDDAISHRVIRRLKQGTGNRRALHYWTIASIMVFGFSSKSTSEQQSHFSI
jgi:hypothetical protein